MSITVLGTALITGASTGIGAIYADRLARRGYDLILVARDAGRMEEIAGRLRTETGRRIEILPADLTDRADLATVEARLAGDDAITLLVNNAGMSLTGELLENDAAAVERLLALNVTAPTLLALAAAKAFVGRRAGSIVNLSSILALAPEISEGVYSGSKAYLLDFTLSLAAKLNDAGVRIQAVLPGATRTEIWERSGKDVNAFPAEMVMSADDLVDAALVGFDKGEVVTIPPLADGLWDEYDAIRLSLAPKLSRRDVAQRYRELAIA